MKDFKNGTLVDYPQDLAPTDVSQQLEEAFQNGALKTTGKVFTSDGKMYESGESPAPNETNMPEYERGGGKYVRIGTREGDHAWIQVQSVQKAIEKGKTLFVGTVGGDGPDERTMEQHLDEFFKGIKTVERKGGKEVEFLTEEQVWGKPSGNVTGAHEGSKDKGAER